jgi:hypothetical protein
MKIVLYYKARELLHSEFDIRILLGMVTGNQEICLYLGEYLLGLLATVMSSHGSVSNSLNSYCMLRVIVLNCTGKLFLVTMMDRPCSQIQTVIHFNINMFHDICFKFVLYEDELELPGTPKNLFRNAFLKSCMSCHL